MKLLECKAVIFDLDGLVIDSETTYIRAWQAAALEMNTVFSPDFCRSLIGSTYAMIKEKIVQQFGQGFDLQAFHQLASDLWYTDVQQHGIPQQAGLDVLLQTILKMELPFCLATNSRQDDARYCLQCAGLNDAFAEIISGDEVQHGKPAPDIFLKAAQILQQPITQCVVLEDSLIGIQAARAAGATVFYIPSHFPISENAHLFYDALFKDLTAVANALQACRQQQNIL